MTVPLKTHTPPGPEFRTLGGRIACRQCNAISKRTQLQCRQPSMSGKTKCYYHGGMSNGPRTTEGRKRIAEANFVHGRESKTIRDDRKRARKRLEQICILAKLIGMIN